MTNKIRHTDYSSEIPGIDFTYDENFYPAELPDPQTDPVLPGASVRLQKVGVGPVELPLTIRRRDGTTQEVYAKASLYGSVDSPQTKGLNFSRFYRLMHVEIEKQMSIEAVKAILNKMAETQKCRDAFCKLKFNYRMDQNALRSRKELPPRLDGDNWLLSDPEVFKIVDGVALGHEMAKGHRFYPVTLEGRMIDGVVKLYMSVDFMYGSTCPCSFTLAEHARRTRNKAANGHSQRSVATVTVELAEDFVWIEDMVEMLRRQIPTEVTVYMKRVDEQAQAELSGSNLLFTEDANRLIYEGLDQWMDEGKIRDFSIVTVHEESIHPYNAIAISYKGVEGGLR